MSTKSKYKNKKKRRTSDEADSDSEHELFYYANDRVQLMKEVLKILKLKKIKALAPDDIKSLDIEEMNTMLFEELLGISNKRLKKILDGQNADDESSSSDEDKIDIISLDSISDDEICFIDEKKDNSHSKSKKNLRSRHRKHSIKKEPKVKSEEKDDKNKTPNKSKPGEESDKVLNVLELLELQARARAIRSQLALEAENKAKETEANCKIAQIDDSDDDDAIVMEVPQINEIVISSSDSEVELNNTNDKSKSSNGKQTTDITSTSTPEKSATSKKIKINLIGNVLLDSPSVNNINDIPLPTGQSPKGTDEPLQNAETSKSENGENIKVVSKPVEEKPLTDEIKTTASATKEHKETRRISTDNDDDVIQIDIVEIDGMDD